MNGFDLFLWTIQSVFLSHIVLLLAVVGPILIVLSIVFLGTGPVLLAFVRSRVGQILIAAALMLAAGWELRAYFDDSLALKQQLVTERRDAAAALDAERARAAVAAAQAAENRRQAEAARSIAIDAVARQAQADEAAQSLQEEVDAYENDPDAGSKQAGDPSRFRLSDADARRLRGIGAAGRR